MEDSNKKRNSYRGAVNPVLNDEWTRAAYISLKTTELGEKTAELNRLKYGYIDKYRELLTNYDLTTEDRNGKVSDLRDEYKADREGSIVDAVKLRKEILTLEGQPASLYRLKEMLGFDGKDFHAGKDDAVLADMEKESRTAVKVDRVKHLSDKCATLLSSAQEKDKQRLEELQKQLKGAKVGGSVVGLESAKAAAGKFGDISTAKLDKILDELRVLGQDAPKQTDPNHLTNKEKRVKINKLKGEIGSLLGNDNYETLSKDLKSGIATLKEEISKVRVYDSMLEKVRHGQGTVPTARLNDFERRLTAFEEQVAKLPNAPSHGIKRTASLSALNMPSHQAQVDGLTDAPSRGIKRAASFPELKDVGAADGSPEITPEGSSKRISQGRSLGGSSKFESTDL
ncbi:MAG: hypothetical protein OEY79_01535 [Anaplasmataceae bacterium]|nr:hypothetical protein [Anaplasmataceae bacterium]